MVQWLRLHASTEGTVCLIPGGETTSHMPCTMWPKRGKRQERSRRREERKESGVLVTIAAQEVIPKQNRTAAI